MSNLTDRFFQRLFNSQIVLALILVSLGTSMGCRNDAAAGKLPLEGSAAIKVNVFQPKRIDNAVETSSHFGKLKASRSQTLGFPVGGSLTTAPTTQQNFASGETIATLDSTQLVEQLKKLQEKANTSLPAVTSNNPLNRSPKEQLQDQIAELQNQISQRTIKAPFDCLVQNTFAQQNSLVGANRPIVSVVETKTPEIEIFLPHQVVKQIQENREYTFLLDDKKIQASAVERAFTESPNGNIRMVFDIKTSLADFNFYLNQTVEARFSFPIEQFGCWLPVACLQQASDGEWFVLAVESVGEPHTIRQLVVQVAQLRDDAVFVTDDLSNQLIVRDGVHRVVSGQEVELNVVEPKADLDATDSGSVGSGPDAAS